MTTSARRAAAAIFALAWLCGAAVALPQAAAAQTGSPIPAAAKDALAGDTAMRPEPSQCIYRAIDARRGTRADDNRLTAWLSVRQPAIAVIKVSGNADSADTGTFAITVMRDGIPVAYSRESRGTGPISADASARVSLVQGQQYKITAKPILSKKTLGQFKMYVGVGKTCP